MAAMRQRFAEAGVGAWNLNVKPDNLPARRLYERCGMHAQYRSTALGLRWELLPSLPGPVVPAREVAPPPPARAEEPARKTVRETVRDVVRTPTRRAA